MSRLEKCVCITYICLAIVIGGFAGYFKVMLSDTPKDTVDEKVVDDSKADNVAKSDNNKGKLLSAAPQLKKHGQVINIDSNLCIREKPDLDSPADDYLYNGMIFDILEKDNDWYKIKYQNAIGYVKENYVKEYDETPPNPTYDQIHSKKSSGNLIKLPIPVKAELTAYCNCAICSEAWGSETAMQTHTRIGVVAAPKQIPLGSKVYISELKDYKEDGIFKVEDRGGAVVVKNDGTYIIDVWLPTHDEVKQFGRKKTIVFITPE